MMDNTVFEVLKVILGPLCTGIITFFITRYTSNRNVPLDKLEVAYNRIYFPIWCLIDTGKTLEEVKVKSSIYIKRNLKYVDKATLRAFEYLAKADKMEEQKAFANFKDSVRKMNTKLRRKLGYLETDIFSEYRFSPPYIKNLYRLSVEIIISYLFLMVWTIISIWGNEWNVYFGWMLLLVLMLLVIELVEFAIRIAVGAIRKKRKSKKRK